MPMSSAESERRTTAGANGETFGHGDGGDPSGARDPRRTGSGRPSVTVRLLQATARSPRSGTESVATLSVATRGHAIVPSGAGREQVVASGNQQEWRRAQMERLQREWMRMRAAKQGGVREHAPTAEKGVTNGGAAPAEAGKPMASQDARGP